MGGPLITGALLVESRRTAEARQGRPSGDRRGTITCSNKYVSEFPAYQKQKKYKTSTDNDRADDNRSNDYSKR
jgi:hypothetical protein